MDKEKYFRKLFNAPSIAHIRDIVREAENEVGGEQSPPFPNKYYMNRIVIILLTLIIIFLSLKTCSISKDLKSKNTLIETLNEDAIIWKDKNNLSHAKITVLEGITAKDFIKLENQSDEIKNLQSLVGEYKKQLKNSGSATIFSTSIIYDTTLIIKLDTINKCSFSDSVSNKYLTAHFNLNNSIFDYSFSYRDSFNIIIGEERDGLFKRKPFVEVKSNNPYSDIKTLRSYQVTDQKSKRFGIGPSIGIGINQSLQPGIYLGIGMNLNLIRL